ncbi:MAG: YdcF family protein [Rhodospirillaceae bacterium]|nr:YdcF family protein [Rhodospirillales bacterium]
MFILSKLMDLLTQPINMALLVLLAACALLFSRRGAALGRTLVCVVTAVLLLLAVLPWDYWLVASLEDRFPQQPLPAHIDGIVVLGGSVDPVVTAARGQPSVNGTVERITAMVELGRHHPEARLVFTGGSGSVTAQALKEAPVARAFLDSLGFDTGRVLFEAQSRNTWENAVFTRDLVTPQPGQIWVLVTSAVHMPRSVGAFRAAGWQVLPYPVDYTTTGSNGGLRFNVAGGLGSVANAMHEFLGMAYYRLRGWSDALYPAP